MKKIALLLFALSAVTACTKGSRSTTAVASSPAEKPYDYISKIEYYYNGSPNKEFEISFDYDDEMRLTSVRRIYDCSTPEAVTTWHLAYTDKGISVTCDDHKLEAGIVKPSEYRLSLDSAGRASEMEETYYTANRPVRWSESDYVYDGDGRLTGYKSSRYGEILLTWQDGNVMRSAVAEGGQPIEQRTFSSKANNTYPDLCLYLADLRGRTDVQFLWGDRMGMRSANLPRSFSASLGDSIPPIYSGFMYRYDSKGRPQEVDRADDTGKVLRIVITYLEK